MNFLAGLRVAVGFPRQISQPRSQGLSSHHLAPGGKMRHPGNEVAD